MNDTALEVRSLSAGYVRGLPVITDVEMTLARHEIVTVIGPNGAGKSTLIKAIAGLVQIESGAVYRAGEDITGLRADRLHVRGIAYVPQTNNVFRTLTIEQNLVLAAKRGLEPREKAIRSVLSLFPILDEKYRNKAATLSGGQRQFLALAMALIAKPDVLLLDEPTAGLSPKAALDVFTLLREVLAGSVSILLVEQNARAALAVSDRAYVLADGRNQHEGRAAELLNDPVVGEIYLGIRRREAHAAESL